MDDAIRVGIFFPRSGQHLFVTVSRQIAQAMMMMAWGNSVQVVKTDRLDTGGGSAGNNDFPRSH